MLPVTGMQRFVMLKRLDGLSAGQVGALLGIGREAVYKRDQRARKRLSSEQRQRYVDALKQLHGKRVRVRAMSLSPAGT
jgi:hypothetical protein